MSFDSLGFRRAITCCVLVGGFLSACGGSGEQTGATDLYGAYEVIDGGMTEAQAQAKAVIGAGPCIYRQSFPQLMVRTVSVA